MAVWSAYGDGTDALWEGLLSGEPAFSPVTRFPVERRRAHVAATVPAADVPDLPGSLAALIDEACGQAGISAAQRRETPCVLALHATATVSEQAENLAGVCGLRSGAVRIYTNACAAGGSALADAAARLHLGECERIVVAGGSLVDAEVFAAFDAAGVLTPEAVSRPFSIGRQGPVLGEGAVALVLQADGCAGPGSGRPLARVAGWGQRGDAYHVYRPHPQGSGVTLAINAALCRAAIKPERIGYINPHATGTDLFDVSEAAGIYGGLGSHARQVPVSSTKALHGHCLEASGLLELLACVLALRKGLLPVNAGFLGADERCPLDLVLGSARRSDAEYALTLNAGFGGTCTALIVQAA